MPLDRPTADFTQQGFAIQQAIDGATQDQLGWAVAPAGGTVHWATFQTRQPVGDGQETVLQVHIHQFHDAKDHRLARFRVSVTNEPSPVGLSLPEVFASALTTNAPTRPEAEKTQVLEYFRRSHPDHQKLQADLREAQQPVPADPGLGAAPRTREAVRAARPDDPALVQLRERRAAKRCAS